MSRIRPFKLNAFDVVTAGSVSKLKLPNGPTYEEIVIETNIPAAKIDKITLDLGGVHSVGQIVEVTGTELLTFEKYKGVTVSEAGPTYYHVIPLGSREAKTDNGQMLSGLVTLPVDNIILNVHLNAALGVLDPVTPFMTPWAYASASRLQRNVIPMIKPHTIVVNGTGEQDYTTLPAEQGLQYRRMYLRDGDLTKVEIYRDGVREFEEDVAVTEFIQKREELVPQVDYVVVDFVRRGWVMADTFKPQHRSELKLRMTVGTAENVRLLIDGFKILNTPQA